mgnify:CR=1 FL=1
MLLLSLIMIFILDVPPVVSQEYAQFAGEMALMRKDYKRFCVDKEEDHYLCLYRFEGTNHSTGQTSFMHLATVTHCLFADVIKRTGPIQGYTSLSSQEGNVVLKWRGQWTTTQSPDDSSLMIFEGTFSILRGTGQYANVEGTGIFKGKMTAPIVLVAEWEGEYIRTK